MSYRLKLGINWRNVNKSTNIGTRSSFSGGRISPGEPNFWRVSKNHLVGALMHNTPGYSHSRQWLFFFLSISPSVRGQLCGVSYFQPRVSHGFAPPLTLLLLIKLWLNKKRRGTSPRKGLPSEAKLPPALPRPRFQQQHRKQQQWRPLTVTGPLNQTLFFSCGSDSRLRRPSVEGVRVALTLFSTIIMQRVRKKRGKTLFFLL